MWLKAELTFPAADAAQLDRLPTRVPGVRVRRTGAGRASIRVPDHAVGLVWDHLYRSTWSVRWANPAQINALSAPWPDLAELGWSVLQRLGAERAFLPGVAESFFDYQLPMVGMATWRGDGQLHGACGSGKTRCAFAWALAMPGPVIFATRVSLTIKVAREYTALTGEPAHLWLPESRRRKKTWEPTADYVDRMHRDGRRPMIIVGHENLPDAVEDILGSFHDRAVTSLVIDEIHRLKSWRRWQASMNVDEEPAEPKGKFARDTNVTFSLKDNIAAAAYLLSRAAVRHLGLTATPVPDRPRDLWSPYDLTNPGEFGKFYDFATRHCGAHPGTFGGIETSGATHTAELAQRLDWIRHVTPLSVVQAGLPELREDIVWLSASELDAPLGGWARELKRAAAAGGESVLEAQLAMTASRKRRWVVEQVTQALEAGQKVLVFTGRRRDVEAIFEGVQKSGAPGVLGWAHGELGPVELQAAVDRYMQADGAAFLVATYDSLGDGQDLQDTDLELVVQIPWSPVVITQTRGRVNRPGQRRPVLVRYVCGVGTLDERAISILAPKLYASGALSQDEAATRTADLLSGVANAEDLLAELAAIVSAADGRVDWNPDTEDESA